MHRNLTSLADAFKAIKELEDTVAYLTTKNLDFHQRQIKNAHPSIDDYDYVVRKELRDGIINKNIEVTGNARPRQVGQLVWIRAILPGLQVIGTDVMDNRFRVELLTGTTIKLIGCYLTAKNANPSTGNYTVDILRSQNESASFTTIFTAGASILNGAHKGQQTTFAIDTLINDDELRLDVISDGEADGIEVVLKGQIV